MSKFIQELKRRNVIKAALAYVVVAWVLLQVLSILLPNIGAPSWVFQTLLLLLIVGFPIWVVFSWVYEVTEQGLRKTGSFPKEHSVSASTSKRLNILILVGLVAAIAILLIRPTTAGAKASVPEGTELSIAVLPFDDMSENKDSEWFCDGVTEDLLTRLSKIEGLRVISRTSTEQFRKTLKSIPEIARELGVSYIVEGSVRKHKNKLLITAQLIDANDKHLWANNYEKELDDVFEIQRDVSHAIVSQLKVVITPEEEKSLSSSSTKNIEAYQLFLKAKMVSDTLRLEGQAIVEGYRKSIELLKEAIDVDPNYADAYAHIAYSYLYLYDIEAEEKSITLAREFNEKALEINANTALVYSNRAYLNNVIDRDVAEAEKNLNKALSLDPKNNDIHKEMVYHYLQNNVYNLEKALVHVNEAEKLNPLSNEIKIMKARVLILNSNFDEAERYLEQIPTYLSIEKNASLIGTKNMLKLKDQQEMIKSYASALEQDPDNSEIHGMLAGFYSSVTKEFSKSVHHRKKQFELDSSRIIAMNYSYALFRIKDFGASKKLLENQIYRRLVGEQGLNQLWQDYYAYQGLYTKATIYHDKIKEQNLSNYYYQRAWLMAKMGKKDSVYAIFKKKEYSPGNIEVAKSSCFALLLERDSVYKYLDKIQEKHLERRLYLARAVNNNPSMDAFAKDPRYREFLKANYLPLPD
ncbi:MAG: hypothetical protein HKO54_04175 [Flavobacteriaceae bacterium]|nr:hypothetical protein [Flavobacteriaceae bacterium]